MNKGFVVLSFFVFVLFVQLVSAESFDSVQIGTTTQKGLLTIKSTVSDHITLQSNNPSTYSIVNINGGRFSILDSGYERFVIKNGGNVGIGTLDPSTKLHVSGQGDQRISLVSTSGAGVQLIANGNDDAWLRTTSDHPLYLGTNNGWGIAISRDNDVGIGTTTPRAKLDVAGAVKASQFCIGNSCITSWPSGTATTAPTTTVGSMVNAPFIVNGENGGQFVVGSAAGIGEGNIPMISISNGNVPGEIKMYVGATQEQRIISDQYLVVEGSLRVKGNIYATGSILSGGGSPPPVSGGGGGGGSGTVIGGPEAGTFDIPEAEYRPCFPFVPCVGAYKITGHKYTFAEPPGGAWKIWGVDESRRTFVVIYKGEGARPKVQSST